MTSCNVIRRYGGVSTKEPLDTGATLLFDFLLLLERSCKSKHHI